MIIVRAPFRVCFFGGSSDYKDFFSNHGAFLIGATINKYIYTTVRYCPRFLSNKSSISYSKLESVNSFNDIKNPLIRETIKFLDLKNHIEAHFLSDIPMRTGLGGSSSFCVSLLGALSLLLGTPIDKKTIANQAIEIERNILKESGGIQDQIWAAYGGFNTIKILENGDFIVRPIQVTKDFQKQFQQSLVLIYTGNQREQENIALSHQNKDKTKILEIAKTSEKLFLQNDIKAIGNLLYESWKEKSKISKLISTSEAENIINRVMSMGAYGAKLLGSGGCGFILVVCNSIVKSKISEFFKNSILDIQFEEYGVNKIYQSK